MATTNHSRVIQLELTLTDIRIPLNGSQITFEYEDDIGWGLQQNYTADFYVYGE